MTPGCSQGQPCLQLSGLFQNNCHDSNPGPLHPTAPRISTHAATPPGVPPPLPSLPSPPRLKLWDITDYWVWHSKSAAHLERLAALGPANLLVMHGSSFSGAGCADMVRELSKLRAGYEPSAAA